MPFLALARHFLTRRREINVIKPLLLWEDALLLDIGLTRQDVIGAISCPFQKSPLAELSGYANANFLEWTCRWHSTHQTSSFELPKAA